MVPLPTVGSCALASLGASTFPCLFGQMVGHELARPPPADGGTSTLHPVQRSRARRDAIRMSAFLAGKGACIQAAPTGYCGAGGRTEVAPYPPGLFYGMRSLTPVY